MILRPIISIIVFIAVITMSVPLHAAQNKRKENAGSGAFKREHLPRYRDGELIIKYKKKASEAEQREVSERLNNKHGATKRRNFKRLRMQHVKLKAGMTVEQAMAIFQADPDVEYVQPNYRYRLHGIPDDSRYGELWNMAKIKAPQAWDLATGSPVLVVGTIDTGIDYNHPDLQANVWKNSSELAGNGTVDDDANGYVDDIYGWNTLTDSGDPWDDESHGTHVAGTIGAAGNNGIGVAGVNWNVKIMACKAFDNTGNGLSSDIIECLQYFKVMKDKGVNLVATNNSYSGDPYDQAMIDAMNLMPDVLFVAAASNDGTDNDILPYYPAGYRLPNVIAVAATDADDTIAGFSNYGKYSVHVAAPGVSVVSTVPVTVDVLPGDAYSSKSGTSMAAPHVVGLAALLKAHDPARDWKTIRNLILTGADPVASVADITITGGRINALNSLACSNRTVTAILEYPLTITAGVPATVSVLNIRCGALAGPVSITIEGVGVLALVDDGAGADLAAGDGIYTVSWTPPDIQTRVATVAASGFSKTFEVPTLRIESTVAASPAKLVATDTFLAPTGVPYSQTFSVLGGRAPLVWSVTTPLPDGLSISAASGTLSGTPTTPGNYTIAVQVKDALEYTATFSSSLTLAAGIKNGWPKTMTLRPLYGNALSQFTYPPVLADLNGDGSDEIVVADKNANDENSSLYLFDRDGLVAGRSDFTSDLSTPAIADLNDDGTPEIIVAERSRNSDTNPALMIHVLDSQTLADVPWFTAGSYRINNYLFKSVTVEDLDGDGAPEIIAMGRAYALLPDDPEYARNALFVLNADGSIVSGWPKIFDTDTDNDRGVTVGDLDATGTRQIVVVDNGGMVRIYAKDGTELQAWGYNGKAMGTSEISVNPVLADLDGDGKLEIIAAFAEYDTRLVQRIAAFKPDGTMLPGWPRGFSGSVAQSFSAADLFNDGRAVVILPFRSTERGSELLILRGDGTTAPGWPVSLGDAVFNNYHEPLVADINGDGVNEVLVNLLRPACVNLVDCYTNNAFIESYGADGVKTIGFPKPIPDNAEIWSHPAVGDVDNDGMADIVAKSEDGQIHIWSEAAPYLNRTFPWPQYRHDVRRSGAAVVASAALYPTIHTVTSPTTLASQLISGTRPSGVAVSVTQNGVPVVPGYPTASTWQASLSGMSEGVNRIRVVADGRTAVGSVVVDTLAPLVTITNPANGFVSSYYQHMVTWHVTDSSETTSRVFLDNIELPITSGQYMPDFADGTYQLRVEVTDAMNRTSTAGSTFIIDSTAPVITLQSPENARSYQSAPQLLYSITKAPISTVKITLDGNTVAKLSGDSLSPLTPGSHTLKIDATDDVGQSSSVSINFNIDAVLSPTVVTGSATSITAKSVVLNGTASANGAAANVIFEYGLTTDYSSNVEYSSNPLASGASGIAVSAAIAGLSCGSTYHYRVTGTSSNGTSYGSDATFTTTACIPENGPVCSILPADNVWNTPIENLPVAVNSSQYIGKIGTAGSLHPDFGAGVYDGGPIGIPYILVPGAQAKVPVIFDYTDDSDPGPYPFPANAAIEGGSESTGDRHVLAVDTDNCLLYETWSSYPQPDGSWQAGSGAVFNLNSNALRTSSLTSADAAGLPILPGLVRYDEVASGEIRHALRFTAPQTQKAFVWPARHYASAITDTDYPPLGQRFRLKSTFDISSFSPDSQVIMSALKKYGMFLADNGSAWFLSGVPDERWDNDALVSEFAQIHGSDFEAVDESSLMIDINSGQAHQPASAPAVTTGIASSVTQTSATLNATVSANGAVATVTFQYGTTEGYGSTVSAVQSPLASGATASAVSAPISGLTCGAIYHVRTVGTNSSGTTNGNVTTFTTGACPDGAPVYTWSATGGTNNTVYRTSPDGTLVLLASLSAAQLSYTDSSILLPNTIYTYCVKADDIGACLQPYTIHTPLYNGWNIVGVPYDTTGIAAATVFNSPVSAVYEWIPTSNTNPDNSGVYTTVATLTPGKGYFVKSGNSSTLMTYSGAANPAGVNMVLKPGYTLISNTQTTNMTNIGTNWLIDGAPLATYINAIPPKIGGAVYWWNGINYDSWNILDLIPAMQPVIEPWKAYWLLNLDTINHTLTLQ